MRLSKYFAAFKFAFLINTASSYASYKLINLDDHKIYKYEFSNPSDLELIKSLDYGALSTENVLSASKRHNAKAAFNGGFFYYDSTRLDGIPVSLFINKHNIYAINTKKDAIYQTSDSEIHIGKVKSKIVLNCKNGRKIKLDSINNPKDPGLILFTPNYSRSTLSSKNTLEIVVKDNKVSEINQNGNNLIPENGFIISAEQIKLPRGISDLKIGDIISYEIKLYEDSKKLERASINWLLSGSDIMIKNGKILPGIIDKSNKSNFRDLEHARTAFCKLANGKYAAYIVDHNPSLKPYDITIRELVSPLKKSGISREEALGMPAGKLLQIYTDLNKSNDFSIGISLLKLANFMQQDGCLDAINLDGGGSSTLVVENKIVNTPAGIQNKFIDGKNIREVSDIFIIR